MLNIDKNLARKWNAILNRELEADRKAAESEEGTAEVGPTMELGQVLEDIPDGVTLTDELTSARFGFDGELVGYRYELGASESECQGETALVVTCWKCRVSAAQTFEDAADAEAFVGYHGRKTGHRAVITRVTVGDCDSDTCPEHSEFPALWFAGNGEPVVRDETEQAGDNPRSTWESPDDFHRQYGPEPRKGGKRAMIQAFHPDGKAKRSPEEIKRYLAAKAERDERFERIKARIERADAEKLRGAHRWLWNEYKNGVKRAANAGGRHWKRRDGELKLAGGTPNWEKLWLTKAQTQELSRLITARLEAEDKPKREAAAAAF